MSNNFYVSPPASEDELPSVKPELNETLMNTKGAKRLIFPDGTFRSNMRAKVKSRRWGNTPFFTNAKLASMLERGWVRSRVALRPGQKGLYTVKDGPEIEVSVISRGQRYNGSPRNSVLQYIFLDTNGNNIDASEKDRYEEWDFYTATNPVPFVPRKGGKRKSRKHDSKKRKTRRKA